MVQSYRKTADYDQLLRTLEFLFPKKDGLQHLFRGEKPFGQAND